MPLQRIGLNLLYLVPGEVGGTEIYARNLVASLVRQRPEVDFTAYVGPESVDWLKGEGLPQNLSLVKSPVRSRRKPLRVLAEATWLPWRVRRDRMQLLHSFGTTAPPRAPVPSVVTIHDLIYHHYRHTFGSLSGRGLGLIVPAAARGATRVIADSQAAREDICTTLGVDPAKVDVVHLGCGQPPSVEPTARPEVERRYGLGGGPVVLTVSASLEHKNLPRLIESFAQLDADRNATLVVAGHSGRERPGLEALARRLGVPDRVVFTGWIEQRDLEGFYAVADLFVYPSMMEGFGMPVLEAMQRGVAVACSNVSALPEVAGDAADLFDPCSRTSITAALKRMLDDPARRSELIERGRRRLTMFSWDRAARETLAVYERALPARLPARQQHQHHAPVGT